MGPWCLIGILLLLTATAGDSLPHLQQHFKKYENLHNQHHHQQEQNQQNNDGNGLSSSANQLLNSIQNSMNEGSVSPNAIVEEPEFTEHIENVTVPAGRNVKLGCSVKNLGSYKVAWMHFEQSAILTVHNHVITRNPRISVTHDKHDRHRTWYLHINNVQKEDKGRYMCQINTVAAKTQFGYLEVVVPPNIDDSLSSSDVIVREGTNISLRCRATGSPQPTVKWKRDDNSKISISNFNKYEVHEWEGDTLEITKISRLDMGAYLCIASNGVPPTVSKRIKVSVDFPPMLLIPHQLVGAPEGYNVTIECFAEAYPTSLNYWTRGEGPIIHDSIKYKVESTIGAPNYKTHMKLTIFNITIDDDGTYKCVAKNPRGDTDGTIRLYVQTPATTPQGILTTEWEQKNFGNNFNLPKSMYNDKDKKYPSNLNDINSFEQKSLSNLDEYGWPSSTFDNFTLYRNSSNSNKIILDLLNINKILSVFCILWILIQNNIGICFMYA